MMEPSAAPSPTPWQVYRPVASPTVARPATGSGFQPPQAPNPVPSSAPVFWSLPGPAQEGAGTFRGGTPLAGHVVRVGFLGPLTGPASPYGESCRRGIELALADAAASGPGPSFELVAVDDAGDEVKAGAGAVKLAHEDKVVAILGAVNSASTHVAARVAAMAGCPQLTSVSTDPALTRTNNRWLFRNLADDTLQGAALARYLYDTRSLKRIALLHDDNRYGRGGARVIRSESERRGLPLVLDREFARGTTVFDGLAQDVAASKAEAVVIWGLFAEAADIAKALSASGIRALVTGGDGLASPAFLARAQAAAEGAVVTYPFDPAAANPETRGFVERYQARHGAPPDSFAAHSYDAAMAVVRAVREVGADRERVRAALAGMPPSRGVAGSFELDEAGNARAAVELAVVQDGRFRPLAANEALTTSR
ncbi:MAG: ABC transporter substrate-binding protein [Candidatus Wallbacteria bacterium]|nr:ABC transporter substrate-binding protein [Candidatus Wallbacteria bacterium]